MTLDPEDEKPAEPIEPTEAEAPPEATEADPPAEAFDGEEPTHADAPPAGDAVEPSPHLESIVESLLFAADKPLSLRDLGNLLGERDPEKLRAAVEALKAHYEPRGVQLHAVAGGFQFRTHPENAAWVQKLLAARPVRLSRAQLETLAIVAYRQPITRPEIDEIRGVDSGGTLKTLMDRSLIRILGKKEEPGRPMLYGTTKEFLEFFNLPDLKDLPTLREFHELSEEHKAQVEALESAAPEGSIETAEEEAAAEAARKPLERVNLPQPTDDAAELEEIDRLISTAGGDKIVDPLASPEPETPDAPKPEAE